MPTVKFYSEETKKPQLNERQTAGFLKNIIKDEGKRAGNISVIFCTDKYLLKINREFLKHDYYTDIITFDYCENDLVSGDIFISVERIKENSNKFNVLFYHELNRVIFHGVLHLTGYKDKSHEEFKLMREKENYYLKKYIKDK